MDIRDRSTYPSTLESLGAGMPVRARTDSGSASAITSFASEQDSSNLSPAAQVVAQTMQLPEIRQDRVASLQQQIASGSYQIAPQQVADAMLRSVAG